MRPLAYSPPRLWQVPGDDGRLTLQWSDRPHGVWRRAAAQWVIERSQCLYRCLDFSHVPRGQRSQALSTKLPSLSPYRSPGYYAVWRGGQVMLWLWDHELQLEMAQQSNGFPRHYRCLPETLLQSPVLVDAPNHVRLLAGRLGHDLQVWKSGVLLLSIHYRSPPSPEQMSLVIRGVGGIDAHSGVAAEQAQYLALPWAGGGQGIQADWERWMPHALLAVLLLGGIFQLTQGVSWWMEARSLQGEHEQLMERLDNLLTARTRAQQAHDAIEKLQQRMQASPLQIELLRKISGLLPPDSKLSHWRFAGNDLELLITTQNTDPRFFVKRLEEEGGFHNVKVEPSPRGDGLQLVMVLK